MKEPLVYIILVNYNGIEDTLDCVNSLSDITYSNYRIVIVDNASADADRIKTNTILNEKAHIIITLENGGFSYGNNIGIEYAISQSADYVLLLNNDTTVEPNFLTELVDTANRNTNAGIVTGNIKYYSNKNEYWYSCGSYNRNTGITHAVNQIDNHENKKRVTFASGCLMLISTKCIQTCGKLEEKFYMYSEDTEYCLRCERLGFEIWWNPKAIIYHKVGKTIGNNTYLQGYYMTRNNLYVAKEYTPCKVYAYMVRLVLCILDVARGNIKCKAVTDGYRDFVKKVIGKK